MKKKIIATNNYWLYIEPVVYITFTKDDVLFYNTERGNYLIYHHNIVINKIAKRLQNSTNNYCILISEEEKQTKFSKFISDIQKKFIGDIVSQKEAVVKPMLFTPIYRINNSIEHIKQRKYLTDSLDPRHYYLTQLSIITNNIHCTDETTITNAHKQFFYPRFEKEYHTLTPEELVLFIKKINLDVHIRINITGSKIFEEPQFYAFLAKELNKTAHTIHLYLPDQKGLTMDSAYEIFDKTAEYHQYINLTSNTNDKKTITEKPEREIIFIVSNETQLEEAEKIMNQHPTMQYSFQLYYTENNFSFLKRNLFLTKEDIVGSGNTIDDIFRKSEINPYFFGEMMVSPEGKIFSNLYQHKLGNIYNTHYNDLISAELMRVNFWRLTRLKVKPCNNCIYRVLCPPITNYERTLGRYNLCYKTMKKNR